MNNVFIQMCICGIIFFLICVACNESADVSENEPHFQNGDPVVISYGESKLLYDTSSGKFYELKFTGDVSDDRCYLAICSQCYGSYASITLTLTDRQQPSHTGNVNLNITGCATVVQCSEETLSEPVLDLQLCLEQLAPYPNGDSIILKDYAATIKFNKR